MIFLLLLGLGIGGLIFAIYRLKTMEKDSAENQNKRGSYKAMIIASIILLVLLGIFVALICWSIFGAHRK
ncbi:MAG: hypothetical protein IKQ43_05110 [Treponema sp.]|nr:hypothetical protein [Treponema sp.]MBR7080422.1 hypothetical protein [Treponema sp.]